MPALLIRLVRGVLLRRVVDTEVKHWWMEGMELVSHLVMWIDGWWIARVDREARSVLWCERTHAKIVVGGMVEESWRTKSRPRPRFAPVMR